MNILQVTPSFYPAFSNGGTAEAVYQLSRALAGLGHDVRVLTTNADGREVLDVETSLDVDLDGVKARYCRRWIRGTDGSPGLLRLLPASVRWADVIHLVGVYSFTTLPVLTLCRLFRKPLVWSPHGAFQTWDGSRRRRLKTWWNRICRLLAPRDTAIHVTCEQELAETRSAMPGVSVFSEPNGVELPGRVERHSATSGLRLLFIGRLHPKKGIENLLQACGLLKSVFPGRWSLNIAGAGDPEYVQQLRALAARLGLEEQVTFAGAMYGRRREEAFAAADLVVVPSHTENFGMVVAEALARALPVIASTGTPWQALEERGCGLWVANDPPALCDAIRRIAAMPLRAMGEAGRAWMEGEYAWDSVAARMAAVYARLGTRAAPARPVKVCLASSIGGHLQELMQLRPVYERYPHFYVVNENISLPPAMQDKTYIIKHSERDLLFFWNLWEAFRIFRRERPTHIVSTGAGLAVPLALVGWLFHIRVLFIETFNAVYKPSLSGRLMYYIADQLLYQWQYLNASFRRGTYAGSIFSVRHGGDGEAAV